jgi:MoaA/NifB/PqqE/SkfB family radical SAM enzyme
MAGEYQTINEEIYKGYNRFRPDGPKPLFCYVPFNNMSFSFEGRVLACAYNQKVELGHYPQSTIADMWFNSESGNKLREHMQHNDLSYGCKHCLYFFNNRKFSGLKPLVFDKYSEIQDINYPKVLEFELSNTCNLECVMCNGKVSSSIRSNRDKLPPIPAVYDDEFVSQLKEFIPHIKEAKFYGGEPFLIPIYHKIWELILTLNPKTKIFVITNGTTLNSRIKDLLNRGDFDIAVSMDSTEKEQLESIRLNTKHEVVIENIQYLNSYCQKRNKSLVISFTLMRINWKEIIKIIRFCNTLNAVLYVSYLKTPPQFAVWNLDTEYLMKMLTELRGEKFPENNYPQKNNKRCYDDLITYLESCAAANRSRPTEEIIPFEIKTPDLPKINQPVVERAKRNEVAENITVASLPGNDIAEIQVAVEPASVKSSGYLADKHYMELLRNKVHTYLETRSNSSTTAAFIISKLDRIFNENFTGHDKNKFFFIVCNSPIHAVVEDSLSFSEDELKQAMASVLR